MPKVCYTSSAQRGLDICIFCKEWVSLEDVGVDTHLVINGEVEQAGRSDVTLHPLCYVPEQRRLSQRVLHAHRCFQIARGLDAHIYDVHVAQLIPYAWMLTRADKKVILDAHQDPAADVLFEEWNPVAARWQVVFVSGQLEHRTTACCAVVAPSCIGGRFKRTNEHVVVANYYLRPMNLTCNATAMLVRVQVGYAGGIDVSCAIRETGDFDDASLRDEIRYCRGWHQANELGQIDRRQVAQLLSRSFAGLVTRRPVPDYFHAQASKIFEYMFASVPVSASNFPLWRNIIERNECGLRVNPIDRAAIAAAIQYLHDRPREVTRIVNSGRRAVTHHYRWCGKARSLSRITRPCCQKIVQSLSSLLSSYIMRILYINHYAGSPEHGMEYRPHYMARHWARMGHEVTLVAASATHLRYKDPAITRDLEEEIINGVRYLWLQTPRYETNGVKRVVNMAAFVTKLFRYKRALAQRVAPDVVIASSTYTWDIFPAHAIARLAKAKMVFEVHDLWPLTPVQLGGMSRWHPFIISLQWGEDYACRHADAVVSMLPFANEHLCQHGMRPDKFHYVPNGVELCEWQSQTGALPAAHQQLLATCRRKQRFVLCYAGSYSVSNALDDLLHAATLVSDQPVDIVLVGQGPEKERLERLAATLGLTNIHILDPVPKEVIPVLLRSVDGLFMGSKKQPLYRFGVSPNKLMDYMAAGTPIVNATDARNDPVAATGCGISVQPEDPQALAFAIARLVRLPPEDRERMGQAGKTYVHAHHDYQTLARQFLHAF